MRARGHANLNRVLPPCPPERQDAAPFGTLAPVSGASQGRAAMSEACPCCAPLPRRLLLVAPVAASLAAPAFAGGEPRRLALFNLNTGERFEGVYAWGAEHDPAAAARLAWLLRDHRADQAHPIDPALLDTLWLLDRRIPGRGFEVISAYRTPATQAELAARWGRAAETSLHTEGRAIDIRRPGLHPLGLVGAAWQLGRGGVGLYRGASPFVHLDTGPRRRW